MNQTEENGRNASNEKHDAPKQSEKAKYKIKRSLCEQYKITPGAVRRVYRGKLAGKPELHLLEDQFSKSSFDQATTLKGKGVTWNTYCQIAEHIALLFPLPAGITFSEITEDEFIPFLSEGYAGLEVRAEERNQPTEPKISEGRDKEDPVPPPNHGWPKKKITALVAGLIVVGLIAGITAWSLSGKGDDGPPTAKEPVYAIDAFFAKSDNQLHIKDTPVSLAKELPVYADIKVSDITDDLIRILSEHKLLQDDAAIARLSTKIFGCISRELRGTANTNDPDRLGFEAEVLRLCQSPLAATKIYERLLSKDDVVLTDLQRIQFTYQYGDSLVDLVTADSDNRHLATKAYKQYENAIAIAEKSDSVPDYEKSIVFNNTGVCLNRFADMGIVPYVESRLLAAAFLCKAIELSGDYESDGYQARLHAEQIGMLQVNLAMLLRDRYVSGDVLDESVLTPLRAGLRKRLNSVDKAWLPLANKCALLTFECDRLLPLTIPVKDFPDGWFKQLDEAKKFFEREVVPLKGESDSDLVHSRIDLTHLSILLYETASVVFGKSSRDIDVILSEAKPIYDRWHDHPEVVLAQKEELRRFYGSILARAIVHKPRSNSLHEMSAQFNQNALLWVEQNRLPLATYCEFFIIEQIRLGSTIRLFLAEYEEIVEIVSKSIELAESATSPNSWQGCYGTLLTTRELIRAYRYGNKDKDDQLEKKRVQLEQKIKNLEASMKQRSSEQGPDRFTQFSLGSLAENKQRFDESLQSLDNWLKSNDKKQ